MVLSYELLSEFAKITNDQTNTQTETKMYGTVVKQGNDYYVRLDGSDGTLTPFDKTVTVKDGDRILCTISNHQVVVTGSTSNPSFSSSDGNALGEKITEFDEIVAHRITADEIHAIDGYFEYIYAIIGKYDNLDAIYAKIENLYAMYADVDHLNAKDIEAIKAYIESLNAEFIDAGVIRADDLEAIQGYFERLQAYTADFVYVSAEVLEAMMAQIKMLDVESLKAQFAQIDFANINEAAIKKLQSNFIDVNFANISVAAIDNLIAKMVEIDFATINEATIESLKAMYANIDFSNIGEAAIRKLFADTGLIKDLVTENGTITGELVGVTIKGDLIEGGTIVADKLVVKGEDGLYYKLNLEGLGKEALEKIIEEDFGGDGTVFQDGLHGSTIIAHTITADRINVTDLVAFDATIGGFNITEKSIYSGVKESVHNTTKGIYLDRDGQIAIGDELHYLKYYYDKETDTYKLEITADSILFKGTNRSVEEAINDINKKVDESIKNLDRTIIAIVTEYSTNDDPQNPPIDEWSTDTPIWEEGKYIWSRTTIEYSDGDKEIGSPVCITGNKGSDGIGENGKGVKSIIEEYYLSSSNIECKNGEWTTDIPNWELGTFIWMRLRIEWTYDGETIEETTYTEPYLAEALNTANENIYNIDKKLNKWIKYVDTYYSTNNSDVSPPNGNWVISISDVVPNTCLWSKTIVYYNDDTFYELAPIYVGKFTSDNIPEIKITEQSDTGYNFENVSDNVYKSTNQQKNSTTCQSTFSYYSYINNTILISYIQDSELNYDYLTINGQSTKGNSSGEYYWNVVPGDNDIIIKYSKDNSQSNGTDTATIDFSYHIIPIKSIQNEYYLSDDRNSLSNGEWYSVFPIIDNPEKYLWKRDRIIWFNDSVSYSDPYLVNKCYINVTDTLHDIEQSLNNVFGTTQNGWEMAFNVLTQNFNEIGRYIRFENGNIILGEEGNSVILKIENDTIGFYQFGEKVAYLTNNKLMVTEVQINTSLKMGNYAFVPGAKGNLTFKKVVK